MIESIRIRNFQAHSDLLLELGHGVTTIVGPTDRGKSSILRALRWLCLNRPAGAAFVKHGASECAVTALVDGQMVSRFRAPAVNGYSLGEDTFKSFGSDVPAPVATLLKTSEVNFQRQHDAPFWLGLPAGEVSRALNSVVDLSRIDQALGRAASVVRKAESEVEVGTSRLRAAEETSESLNWVTAARREWDRIASARSRAEELDGRAAALQSAASGCVAVSERLRTVSAKRRDLEKLATVAGKSAEAGVRAGELRAIIASVNDVEGKLCRTIESSRRLEEKLAAVSCCPLCRQPLRGSALSRS